MESLCVEERCNSVDFDERHNADGAHKGLAAVAGHAGAKGLCSTHRRRSSVCEMDWSFVYVRSLFRSQETLRCTDAIPDHRSRRE